MTDFYLVKSKLTLARTIAPIKSSYEIPSDQWFLSTLSYTWEKEMATHSSTLAWKTPWTEEPHRLQSMGSQRVRHDWETSLHFSYTCGSFVYHHWRNVCESPSLIYTYIFLLLNCRWYLCILDFNFLSDIGFTNIFSYSTGCLFIYLLYPLLCWGFLVWCNPTCLFLVLLPVLLTSHPKQKQKIKSLLRTISIFSLFFFF